MRDQLVFLPLFLAAYWIFFLWLLLRFFFFSLIMCLGVDFHKFKKMFDFSPTHCFLYNSSWRFLVWILTSSFIFLLQCFICYYFHLEYFSSQTVCLSFAEIQCVSFISLSSMHILSSTFLTIWCVLIIFIISILVSYSTHPNMI